MQFIVKNGKMEKINSGDIESIDISSWVLSDFSDWLLEEFYRQAIENEWFELAKKFSKEINRRSNPPKAK